MFENNTKKVALVACMRKLLSALNAMLKQRISWQIYADAYFNRSTDVYQASQGRDLSPRFSTSPVRAGGAVVAAQRPALA